MKQQGEGDETPASSKSRESDETGLEENKKQQGEDEETPASSTSRASDETGLKDNRK